MVNQPQQPIAILGAGSWGSALAVHLAKLGQTVHLWEFDRSQLALLKHSRRNDRYLPGVDFPPTIQLFDELSLAVAGVKDILIVVPSHFFRQTLLSLKDFINETHRIVWATKGIDGLTGHLLHRAVEEILGKRAMAVLSGPSFAKEVAIGLPTAVSVASNDASFSRELVERFNGQAFRVYSCDDLIGVELGGALKNVIAIAVGASDGLRFGANARSALITRGLAEITRLGIAMGAKKDTFMGLAGVGDLVLTCTDDQSRNRRLGLAVARGEKIEDAKRAIGQVVEGAETAHQAMRLAQEYGIDMPICRQVDRILRNEILLKDAVVELLARAPKPE